MLSVEMRCHEDYLQEFSESGSHTELGIKLFADTADLAEILDTRRSYLISGFTTNPSLMKKAGVTDYKSFAINVLSLINDRPISFEVLSNDFEEMEYQARKIASWSANVYVKIPIRNTRAESSVALVERLTRARIKVNVTAIMNVDQVREVIPALAGSPGAYLSVFAGRIADTGRDPIPVVEEVIECVQDFPTIEVIWASTREVLNIIQARQTGCHIITVPTNILEKTGFLGKDLEELSVETVQMFYRDAQAANLAL